MDKKNIILSLFLIILIGIAYFYSGPLKDWQKEREKVKNIFVNLDSKEISQIEIIKNGKKTVLTKNGSRWKINDTKDFFVSEADAVEIKNKLEELSTADFELASQNKEKKVDFQTDETQSTLVKIKSAEREIISFVIGKPSNDYMSAYISQNNSERTYLIKSRIDFFAKDDWFDKTILSSDKTKISKIRFQFPDQEFEVVKNGENWLAGKSDKLDNKKVEVILDTIANLSASEIPEQNFIIAGLDKKPTIIQITGEEIDDTIMIGKENDKGLYYAKKGNSDNIYLISKEDRDKIAKRVKDLK